VKCALQNEKSLSQSTQFDSDYFFAQNYVIKPLNAIFCLLIVSKNTKNVNVMGVINKIYFAVYNYQIVYFLAKVMKNKVFYQNNGVSGIKRRDISRMDNYVFKRDYSRDDEFDNESEVTAEDLLPSSMVRDYLKFHTEFMRRLPKIIVQKDKETFERVVPKLNRLAKLLNGTIEATVDYEKWDSHIILTMPMFELVRDEEREIFADVIQNSHCFNITTTEDGKVRMYILINYFEEIMPGDWESMNKIADDVILDMDEE